MLTFIFFKFNKRYQRNVKSNHLFIIPKYTNVYPEKVIYKNNRPLNRFIFPHNRKSFHLNLRLACRSSCAATPEVFVKRLKATWLWLAGVSCQPGSVFCAGMELTRRSKYPARFCSVGNVAPLCAAWTSETGCCRDKMVLYVQNAVPRGLPC